MGLVIVILYQGLGTVDHRIATVALHIVIGRDHHIVTSHIAVIDLRITRLIARRTVTNQPASIDLIHMVIDCTSHTLVLLVVHVNHKVVDRKVVDNSGLAKHQSWDHNEGSYTVHSDHTYHIDSHLKARLEHIDHTQATMAVMIAGVDYSSRNHLWVHRKIWAHAHRSPNQLLGEWFNSLTWKKVFSYLLLKFYSYLFCLNEITFLLEFVDLLS